LITSYDIPPGNSVGLFWWKGKGWTKEKYVKQMKKVKKRKK